MKIMDEERVGFSIDVDKGASYNIFVLPNGQWKILISSKYCDRYAPKETFASLSEALMWLQNNLKEKVYDCR